ncbi:thiamine phosphate synthase [Sphingobacterium psychroaquaticum]|uniref:Thiamine-phosphate synthase n=1 Tax=Sphingobacterium psychroaquaticum TaxID=561061 RepID=A0A1X7JT60_9SPHI|nr:thiamine phosphate synthase [Sphingobacterium psychroaquaticum]QBQ41162.1 thiamine phosphate synthase [Sphingobacterium psychroaquaticum]SMG31586.1 thiamine-phosphate pyrophosphorylase [Sphingobacterium psychroaquaticum]
MYSKLQYISAGNTQAAQFEQIKAVVDLGIDWVQLRCKTLGEVDFLQLAERVKKLQSTYDFKLIINDNITICKSIDADGVHLGLQDTSIQVARAALGPKKIIGGTANTLEDIHQRIHEGCDYIGLGPLRFTNTKENLSPLLGFEGYRAIFDQLQTSPIPPIYAIGSVDAADIITLRNIGLHGIAVSGLVHNNLSNKNFIQHLQSLLHEQLTYTS